MAFTFEFGTGFEYGQVPIHASRLENGVDVGYSSLQAIQTVTPHTGVYAMTIWSNASGIPCEWRFVRTVAGSEIYVGVWFRQGAFVSAETARIRIYVGANVICDIRRPRNGTMFDAYVGAGLVASGTVGTIPADWHHIQLHVLSHAVNGIIETRIDGVPDITYNGAVGGGDITKVAFMNSSNTSTIDIDDLSIGTGDWPGDIRYELLPVNSDVSVAWTRSAGAVNWDLVDERPASTVDYVYASTDVSDRYGTPGTWDETDGLGTIVKDPIAVVAWANLHKVDGNLDDKIQLTMGDGVDEIVGGYQSLLTSREQRWYLSEVAPDAGAWTTVDVNALILGIDSDIA